MKGRFVRTRINKQIAWLLVLALVMTSVSLPQMTKKASASEVASAFAAGSGSVTIDKNPYGDDYIGDVVFAIPDAVKTKNAISSNGVTGLEVQVTVNSFTADSNPTVNLYVMSTAWNWNASDYAALEIGKTITLTYNFAGMDWNGQTDMGKIGLRFANCQNGSTVSYTINSAKLIKSSTSSEFGTPENRTNSGNVDVSVNFTKSSNDWSQFDLAVNNQTGQKICDWIIELTLTDASLADVFKCWNSTFIAQDGKIFLYPMQSGGNAVLAAGEMTGYQPGGGFSGKYVSAANISVTGVYYNIGTSSEIDYSSGNTNDETGGTGGSGSSGGSSLTDTTTDLNLDIEYNFAKLLQETLYFYDANMCGGDVDEKSAFSWRSDCHTVDKTIVYNGKSVDVSGGFHDAGDHVKFGLPQGYSAAVLALGYYAFGEAYDELGQTEHYQTIMDYFCDYFVNCTVYNGSSVEAFCYQVGEGNSDHGYWGAPEKQTTSRPAYFATSSNPATDEVSIAAAALAMHAYNFPGSANSSKYLKTAKDLFTFVKNNNKSCATEGASGFYSSSDWKDDYCTAAAALKLATKSSDYDSVINDCYTSGNIKTGWVLTWDNTWAIASVLLKDWNTVSTFASYGNNVSAQGFKIVDGWGSARYNTTLQLLGLIYDQNNSTDKYGTWSTGQMKYLLGNNKAKRCFIVGYNENSSKYPHHRAASNSSDANSVNVDGHYTLVGALVGGPSDANDTYADNQGDYNCNEVALDYNAGIVGAAAGLYLLHKNDSAYSTDLASEAELEELKITKYSGSSNTSTQTVNSVTLDSSSLSLVTNGTNTASLNATVSVEGGEAYTGNVTWSSSDSTVATVKGTGNTRTVTAVGNGTATITVTAGGKSAQCTVTVTTDLKGLSLDHTTLSLEVGQQQKLTATADPVNATNCNLSWESSDTSVATVDTSGKVTAVKSGTANITVSSGGFSVKCVVNVVTTVTELTMKSELTLYVGDSGSLNCQVKTADNTEVKASFTSADTSIAQVDADGKVTANKAGSTTITAQAGKKTATCTVTVKKKDRDISALSGMALQLVSRDAGNLQIQPSGTVDGSLAEYSIDGGITWQMTPKFNNLQGFTAYTVKLRYKEDDFYNASAIIATGTFYTLSATPYTIDVSKLSDTNYIDALKDGSASTIIYDSASKTLTLNQAGKAYVLTGENSSVNVVIPSGVTTVNLQGATVASVNNQNDSATLNVNTEGTNTITGSLTGQNGAINISGEGSLAVNGGIDTKGALSISGVDITVKEGIKASEVKISGNTADITGASGKSAIIADKVTLDQTTITVNTGTGAGSDVVAIKAGSVVVNDSQISTNASNISDNDIKDQNGQTVEMQNIIYKDFDGVNVLNSFVAAKGSKITLPSIEQQKGYRKTWTCNNQEYAAGTQVTVNSDMTFTIKLEQIMVETVTLKQNGKALTASDKITLDLRLNQTATLTAEVTPEDALITKVNWSSSDENIVTVASGMLTPKNVGNTVIKVEAADGSGASANVAVEVIKSEEPKQPATDDTDTSSKVNTGTGESSEEIDLGDDEDEDETAQVKLAKVNLKSVKSGKKQLTIQWAKVKNAKGYQISVATNSKFKGAKTVKTKSGNTTKVTLKKLKAKKKYYVRVRAYATSGGKTSYGSWSKTKVAKTKK